MQQINKYPPPKKKKKITFKYALTHTQSERQHDTYMCNFIYFL